MIWPELDPADSEFRRSKPTGIRNLSTTVSAPFNIHSFIHPSKPSRYNWSVFRSVQCQHHKKLCSNVTLHFFIPHILSPIWWCRQNPLLFECRCCPGSDFTRTPYITYCQGEQVAAVFHFLQLLLMCHTLQWGWLSGYSLYVSFSTFISIPYCLPASTCLSVMLRSTVSSLPTSTTSPAYCTVLSTCHPVLESTDLWRATLLS